MPIISIKMTKLVGFASPSTTIRRLNVKIDTYRSLVGGTEWLSMLIDYVVDQLFELNRLGAADPKNDFEIISDKSNTTLFLVIICFLAWLKPHSSFSFSLSLIS